jgi:hypothetical protein
MTDDTDYDWTEVSAQYDTTDECWYVLLRRNEDAEAREYRTVRLDARTDSRIIERDDVTESVAVTAGDVVGRDD